VTAPDYLEILARITERAGWDLAGLGLAWARVAPSVLLIPAFGLSAVPGPTRAVLGLSIAACIGPALGAPAGAQTLPFAAAFVVEFARGLPIALTASLALYAASMAGGLVDNLRGSREQAALPNVDPGATPMGALLAVLTGLLFLESGGAIRVAQALAAPSPPLVGALPGLVRSLTGAIEVAVAVAAPLVGASIVVELASALIARAASPAFIVSLLAPIRAVAVLAIAALLLDRMAELLALLAASWP